MAKYFFTKYYSARCHTKHRIQELLKQQDWAEIQVYKAQMDIGSGVFYCVEFDFCGETGEGCGIECVGYEPRNGKNGRCRHHRNTYSPTDKLVTIKRK